MLEWNTLQLVPHMMHRSNVPPPFFIHIDTCIIVPPLRSWMKISILALTCFPPPPLRIPLLVIDEPPLLWLLQNDPRYYIVDPICTFIFALLVLFTTRLILCDIVDVLMERVPRSLDVATIARRICQACPPPLPTCLRTTVRSIFRPLSTRTKRVMVLKCRMVQTK